MNFDFINELRKTLEGHNIFSYSLTSIIILANVFIIMKMIIVVLKASVEEKFDYMQLVRMGGYILLVSSYSTIIDLFENLFTEIEKYLSVKEDDFYSTIMYNVELKFTSSVKDLDAWDMLFGPIDLLCALLYYLVFLALAALCKIADLSMTAAYLLQRIFIIELLKFLLPVAVVLSLWEKWENMLMSWLKRYFSMVVLGLAYVGIINFIALVRDALQSQFDVTGTISDLSQYMMGTIIVVIVCFTVKVKLFASVTSYIQGYFS